jgi:L,D-peptidoglycan transpeptidase YkuD (ErfK/YbiS/YcfS/YnhG family)
VYSLSPSKRLSLAVAGVLLIAPMGRASAPGRGPRSTVQLASVSARSPCPRNLAASLASTGVSSQLITVEAASSSSTVAQLRLWQRSDSCWSPVAGPWQARLGYAGLSDHHREGDGTTPAGAFTLGPVVYGIASTAVTRYRYRHLVCGDWWDEDPSSAHYNTFQHLRCGAQPPFGGASEALWRETAAYQHFLVVEYNTHPAVPGRGSAIFVHDNLGQPTNGCVSLEPRKLDTLLNWLRPTDRPLIVIGTRSEIRRY